MKQLIVAVSHSARTCQRGPIIHDNATATPITIITACDRNRPLGPCPPVHSRQIIANYRGRSSTSSARSGCTLASFHSRASKRRT